MVTNVKLLLSIFIVHFLLVVVYAASPPVNKSGSVPYRAVERINVEDFLTENSTKDCGPAIQRAIDRCVQLRLGTVWFPPGKYTVRTGIKIPPAGICLLGDSSPWWRYATTKVHWFGEGPLFSLQASESWRTDGWYNGFRMEGISFHGNEFKNDFLRYETNKSFDHDLSFKRVGCGVFGKVFEFVDGPKGSTCGVGGIYFDHCSFHWNRRVIDATKSMLIRLTLSNCYIQFGNQGIEEGDTGYAIDLKSPHDVVIDRCNLEGGPRMLRIRNGTSVHIRQNYWEHHVGEAVVLIEDTKGLRFDRQHYRQLRNDGPGRKFIFRNCPDAVISPQSRVFGGSTQSWEIEK